MGRAGRFACIFLPMLCTISSLICCLLLFLAGTTKSFGGLEDVFVTRVDVRNVSASATFNTHLDKLDSEHLSKALAKLGGNFNGEELKNVDLEDFYSSYLWGYCYGDVDMSSGKKKFKTKGCSKTSVKYAFDIEKIIDDGVGDSEKVNFPENVKKVQKGIATVSQAMIAAYAIGFVATAITAIVGWFGLLSRWGSCVTTIFADLAFGFILIGSACSTFLSYSLHGAFNKAFDEFGVHAEVGKKWLEITWVATGFSFVAAFFWLMSTCCCSGRKKQIMEDGKHGNAAKVERTPYTYERVASPYMGASASKTSIQMNPYGQSPSYEPMRHQQV